MTKIIKKGEKEYQEPFWYHTCIYCNCLFTWTENDWRYNRQVIFCPQCGKGNNWEKIQHKTTPNQKRFLDLFPIKF